MEEMSEKLREELKGCTSEELWLIYDTQKDLYSEDELALIRKMAKERGEREKEDRAAVSRLKAPKMAVCDSCGTVNDPGAGKCINCGKKLKKKKAQDPRKRLERIFYIIGVLCPPAGILISLVLAFSGDTYRRAAGINCFWLSVFSIFLICVIVIIYLTRKV